MGLEHAARAYGTRLAALSCSQRPCCFPACRPLPDIRTASSRSSCPLRRRRHGRYRARAGAGDGKGPRRQHHHPEQAGRGHRIGAQAVAAAEPDGYTLLMGTFANAVNPSLNAKLPFDPTATSRRSRWSRAPSTSSSSIRNRRFARRRSDRGGKGRARKTLLRHFGTGTSAHLAGELFKHLAGVNMTTVPYKGSAPAITDLLGGQIHVMFTTVSSAAA